MSETPSSTPVPTRPSESAEALNRASDASRTSRAAGIRTETGPAPKTGPGPKRAKKTGPAPKRAPRPAPAPAPAPTGRKALTPKERAARPVTATIAAYVEWLDRNRILGPKPLTGPERRAAGIAITLYGAYQTSPERRKARLG